MEAALKIDDGVVVFEKGHYSSVGFAQPHLPYLVQPDPAHSGGVTSRDPMILHCQNVFAETQSLEIEPLKSR